MLKTDCLPSRQEETNNKLSAELRTLLIAGVTMLLVCVAGFCALIYGGPEAQARNAEVLTSDGNVIGVASIVGPDLAIADGSVPGRVQIRLPERKTLDATKVRSETFYAGASLALLRAGEQFPDADVPALGSEPSGSLHGLTQTGDRWAGVTTGDPKAGPLHLDPEAGLTPGTPIYQDQLLVGVAAQAGGHLILVPVRELTAKFKEISGK